MIVVLSEYNMDSESQSSFRLQHISSRPFRSIKGATLLCLDVLYDMRLVRKHWKVLKEKQKNRKIFPKDWIITCLPVPVGKNGLLNAESEYRISLTQKSWVRRTGQELSPSGNQSVCPGR